MMKQFKQTLIVALAIICAAPAFSQEVKEEKTEKRKYNRGTHRSFSVDLGINNWLEDGNFPNDNNELYSVRPWGSWYVGLNLLNDTHVAGPLHLEWGLGVSWNNFKFENEAARLREVPEGIEFYEAPEEPDSEKSKLSAAYLNASMVPMVKFHNKKPRHHHRNYCHGFDNKGGFRIGAGGYVGYKIDSFTKTVVDDDKDRDHDGFYINNVRYGIRGQVGFRGLDLFVNYDLNELFVEGKGPKLNAFSFGVML